MFLKVGEDETGNNRKSGMISLPWWKWKKLFKMKIMHRFKLQIGEYQSTRLDGGTSSRASSIDMVHIFFSRAGSSCSVTHLPCSFQSWRKMHLKIRTIHLWIRLHQLHYWFHMHLSKFVTTFQRPLAMRTLTQFVSRSYTSFLKEDPYKHRCLKRYVLLLSSFLQQATESSWYQLFCLRSSGTSLNQ